MLTKATLLVTPPVIRNLRYKIINLASVSFTNGPRNDIVSKKLFTPGPLNVSETTRRAMLQDVGSRSPEFIDIIGETRHRVISLAGANPEQYTCVPMQGSGTFCSEAVLQTSIPADGGDTVIFTNGIYGRRMETLCRGFKAQCIVHDFPETDKVPIDAVEDILKQNPNFTNVCVIHCETSCGVINDIKSVGKLVRKYCPNAMYFVDAMSSFGAVPVDLAGSHIDFLVTSPNKCIEGVPGFGLIIVDKEKLLQCEGNCRSTSLDLVDQYKGFEANGQFRFTPPTHGILAFRQALIELEQEGGPLGRASRYKTNRDVVCNGLKKMGFRLILEGDHSESYIVTTFKSPPHPNFHFKEFYNRLSDRGMCIYHGQLTDTPDTFRIGHIGHIFPEDSKLLVKGIEEVCREMNIPLPITY